jgi:Domain of unknown function (DUF1707)
VAFDAAQVGTIRVSDAERQAVVAALSKNATEGRLTLKEFEERTGAAYAARTYADLEPLLRDLPEGHRAQLALAPHPVGPGRSGSERGRYRRGPRWSPYPRVIVLCWAIWALTVVTSSRHGYEGFWPLWVMLPWALFMLNRLPMRLRRHW